MRLKLRDVDFETDLEAYRRLRSIGESEPITTDYLRDAESRFPSQSKRLRILAEVNGDPVGLAFWIAHKQYKSGMIWGQLLVEPDHRHQGIGLALWQETRRRAVEMGFSRVWGECREDDSASIQFATRRGSSNVAHIFESVLEINQVEATAEPSVDGIQLTELQSVPDIEDTRRAIYDLFVAADADEPMTHLTGIVPWEDFNKRFDSPIFQKGYLCLAVAESQFVGLAWVIRFSESYYNEFTGVHPDFRGRGIARAMKQRCIEWLRERGVASVRTNNDSRNAPMIAVNERLGYRSEPGWYLFEADL